MNYQWCAEGLLCDRNQPNTCLPPPGLGAPCIGTTCAAGLYCTAAKNCALIPKLGAACTGGCEAGTFCRASVCTAQQAAGAACAMAYECQHGCDTTSLKSRAAPVRCQ